ncbi:MAG: SBBP repeat-containing protein [Saprospiraceae bacterium]|nr:SBBP repeat-containing protein [Candidatus Brachybacter algidus]MBK8746459.1 SBBP repeat-containing protein [Candidatus Brachybacter algidus]
MRILIFLLLTFHIFNLTAAVIPAANSMYFIENKGQLMYQDGSRADDIKYSLISGDMRIDIKSNSIHYSLFQKQYKESIEPIRKGRSNEVELSSISSYRVDVLLEGSNMINEILPSGKIDYYENYYLEGCGVEGVTKVQAFKSLLIKNIYSGIDWRIYIDGNKFKYDFIVHPGADPASIKLKYLGADNIILDQNGNLEIQSPYGSFNENKPYTYEETTKKEITSEYQLIGNRVSFKTGNYSGTMVIDPEIEWCTYYGGTFEDWIGQITFDENNNVLMVGQTSSISNVATTGSHQVNYSGGLYDGLIVLFDEQGVRKWATYYGGSGTDVFAAVQYYKQEFILAGITSSKTNIATPGANQTVHGGGVSDCFLAKFDQQGLRLWASYFGGDDLDGTYPGYPSEPFLDISLDLDGNIFMCGPTASQFGIATQGTHSPLYNGGKCDGFVVKFNNIGNKLWGTYLGGLEDDDLYGIDIDQDNNIVVCGETNSPDGIATSGTHQTIFSGDFDSYIIKLDSSGNRIWGTYFGGINYEVGNNIKVDLDNNIYLIGNTTSSTKISTPNSFQTVIGGGNDGYLQKFNSDGTRIWGTYIGGAGNEYLFGLEVDRDNKIVLSGMTTASFIRAVKGNAIQIAYGGGAFDCIISKLDKNGKQLWGSYYGSNGNDRSWMLNIDLIGNIYIGGGTSSLTKIATQNAHQTQFGGGIGDILLLKISDETLRNDEISYKSNITLYPNPTSGLLQITSDTQLNKLKINVFNCSGQLIPVKIKDNYIDITDAIPGIYFVQVIDGSGDSGVVKVVKM